MNRNLIIGLLVTAAAIVIYLKVVQPPEEPPIVVPPVRPPVVPPVMPPVRPPEAHVPVAWALFVRLFPELAAVIERQYRAAGFPHPPYVMVPPEMLRQAMDKARVRVIA